LLSRTRSSSAAWLALPHDATVISVDGQRRLQAESSIVAPKARGFVVYVSASWQQASRAGTRTTLTPPALHFSAPSVMVT